MNNNNDCYHIKMAAFHELQEALKIKRVNDELLEHLLSSVLWLVNYAKKNNITLPEKDKITEILDKVLLIRRNEQQKKKSIRRYDTKPYYKE
jgi:hypothetical protein